MLAATRTAAAANLWRLYQQHRDSTQRSRLSKLCRPAPHPTLSRPHRQKIRTAGKHELGFAPTFPAARFRHTFASRRRRPSRHSGIARPPIAFHYAKIYTCVDPPADGHLRQGSPARLGTFVDSIKPIHAPSLRVTRE